MISNWCAVLAAESTVVTRAATGFEDRYFESAGVKIRHVEQGSGAQSGDRWRSHTGPGADSLAVTSQKGFEDKSCQ
jgi:hypothetical protein